MNDIQKNTGFSGDQTRSATPLRFRVAQAADAAACAPLIFASGVREFGFFLGEPADVCVAFLRFAFGSRLGRFSWRRHRVAVAADGAVLCVMAAHDGRSVLLDDPHIAYMLLRFFGILQAIGMLWRGLRLESELPAPTRRQTLIAHCATLESRRGTGAFSALFEDARLADLYRGESDREIVLDVLTSNVRARALYQRLGFVEMPRPRAFSQRLPRELESVRMRFR
jgi:ribosomal protein S18 acetylase RimI-like enzyme